MTLKRNTSFLSRTTPPTSSLDIKDTFSSKMSDSKVVPFVNKLYNSCSFSLAHQISSSESPGSNQMMTIATAVATISVGMMMIPYVGPSTVVAVLVLVLLVLALWIASLKAARYAALVATQLSAFLQIVSTCFQTTRSTITGTTQRHTETERVGILTAHSEILTDTETESETATQMDPTNSTLSLSDSSMTADSLDIKTNDSSNHTHYYNRYRREDLYDPSGPDWQNKSHAANILLEDFGYSYYDYAHRDSVLTRSASNQPHSTNMTNMNASHASEHYQSDTPNAYPHTSLQHSNHSLYYSNRRSTEYTYGHSIAEIRLEDYGYGYYDYGQQQYLAPDSTQQHQTVFLPQSHDKQRSSHSSSSSSLSLSLSSLASSSSSSLVLSSYSLSALEQVDFTSSAFQFHASTIQSSLDPVPSTSCSWTSPGCRNACHSSLLTLVDGALGPAQTWNAFAPTINDATHHHMHQQQYHTDAQTTPGPNNMLSNLAHTDSDSKLNECTICFEGFSESTLVRNLPCCKNIFHASCIDTWITSTKRNGCPYCTQSIVQGNLSKNYFQNICERLCTYHL